MFPQVLAHTNCDPGKKKKNTKLITITKFRLVSDRKRTLLLTNQNKVAVLPASMKASALPDPGGPHELKHKPGRQCMGRGLN